ncbi:MAG: hypothetical protein A3E25_00465 [Burkholderiales bacterium RIFCSPHIGHO2_12_FULL_69_20]|nr:MAG: hypothetical protein A3E25_00465 [Burkholderiales bacterium RIFCSPHIGHO2_12_FULL_69_20]
MHHDGRHFQLRQRALAWALLAAFGPVLAQGEVVNASVTVGAGLMMGDAADRAWFGQYNGLRYGDRALGVLDLRYHRRSDAAGTEQIDVLGTRLLTNTRELSLRWQQQGRWRLSADIGQSQRHDPYTLRTGLVGAGSTTPEVVPVAIAGGTDRDLKLKRTSVGVGMWTALSPRFDLDISLKSEEKRGERLFGMGMNCPLPVTPGCRGATTAHTGWALLALPEPVNARHSQIEARVSYAGESLRLSGGYYGSFYNNAHGAMSPRVPGSLNNALGELLPLNTGLQALLNLPVALAPDNQAHQFDVTGNYTVASHTQMRFKLAFGRAEQHQDFRAAGFLDAPAGVANLGGRINTTLAEVGVSSRPLPKLTLVADLRQEDKDDATPLAVYNVAGTLTYTNRALPSRRTRAKASAAYQFSSALKGVLGAHHEAIDRGVFTASSAVGGLSALRQKTDETGLRAELRRLMSESFSASLSLESSQRRGSNWLRPGSTLGVIEVPDPLDPANGFGNTAIFMPTLADRQRDKIKLQADWQPSAAMSVQFSVEDGQDRYRVSSQQGLRHSGIRQVSIDGSYALSDKWGVTGFFSYGDQQLHQSRAEGYILSFRNANTHFGLGLTGKPSDKLQVGAELNWSDDKNVYAQALDGYAPPDSVALLAATGGLPDIVFRQSTLKLFVKADIDKRSSARIDLVHQRARLNDWGWGYNGVPFAYSDGATLWQQPNQQVTAMAVSYTYQWK